MSGEMAERLMLIKASLKKLDLMPIKIDSNSNSIELSDSENEEDTITIESDFEIYF